ncbi:MAG: sugar transferase [Amaricoccus sp.]
MKRPFETVAAMVALFAIMPLMLAIAVAIRLESRGPVLFRQPRFGLNRSVVLVTKFRTMHSYDADLGGRRQTQRGDPRVTRVGRLLRGICLDELPQLWDVICGRMSLVGPRPHPLEMEIEGAPAELVIRDYHARHAVRPGITGLAQVRGNRGPVTSLPMGQQRIEYDVAYVRHCSFALDMKILALTALVPFERNLCY